MYCLAVPHTNVPCHSFQEGSSCLGILPVRGVGRHTERTNGWCHRPQASVVESHMWASVVESRLWSTDGGRWLRVCGGALFRSLWATVSCAPASCQLFAYESSLVPEPHLRCAASLVIFLHILLCLLLHWGASGNFPMLAWQPASSHWTTMVKK